MDLYLIGDAGLPNPRGEPVLQALEKAVGSDPERTFVVFLGDNVYPNGLVDTAGATRREGERILNAQVDALLGAHTRGIIIPGNHDWAAWGPTGWDAMVREQRYVDARGKGTVRVLPAGGCPGPEVLDFGNDLRLIVLDTQWWLHEYAKPQGSSSPCATKTEAQVVDSIRGALRDAGPRATVVVGHHPLVTGGEHGGYFDWPTYLFPFHPWARQAGFFAQQDVTGTNYRKMIARFTQAFHDHPPLVYAAGHEHNLQVFRRDPARYMVVSGGGIYGHTSQVRAITGTQYARRASGFMRMSVLKDGRIRLAVIVVDAAGKAAENFSMWLERPLGVPAASTKPE
ncbi:MAG: metallophosphoesterase, partial [Gemmatimonadetes bacterium]|nr:metallophosphoesterase [Gemmatimonadota bacterium]